MDRAFPGASRCLAGSLLDTKVGRLVIAEFSDPSRLSRLGAARFRRFAAARDVIVSRKVAERFVAAARAALPLDGAATARELVASDLELLDRLEAHADEAEQRISELLPSTPFQVLTTTPGWATVRAGRYGAALGEPARWPTARQVYRAAGLTPKTYESAGTRHDGQICREGSVELRGALLELGMGLWLCDPTSRPYAVSLKARGKPAGIIACAMARRANKIAFAMVRDQKPTTLPTGRTDRPSQPRADVTSSTRRPEQTPHSLWRTAPRLRRLLAWRPASTHVRSPDKAS
nr:transposase [Nitriliruptor alkaliphilus]